MVLLGCPFSLFWYIILVNITMGRERKNNSASRLGLPDVIVIPTTSPFQVSLAPIPSLIKEGEYYVSGGRSIGFSSLYYCLGIILHHLEKPLSLGVHITRLPIDPLLGRPSTVESALKVIETLDRVYQTNPNRGILMSSSGGDYPFHDLLEQAIFDFYGLTCEHYLVKTGLFLPEEDLLCDRKRSPIDPKPAVFKQWD